MSHRIDSFDYAHEHVPVAADYVERLHFVTQDVPHMSLSELIEAACTGGVRWIQLRVKGMEFTDWLRCAYDAQVICKRFGARLVINDNAVVCRQVGAAGVHLGRNDMSPEWARDIVGPDVIIGGSANSESDIARLVRARVDYIGIGPFRLTRTKTDLSPVLGAEGIQRLVSFARSVAPEIPVVAIGGIEIEDVAALLGTGLHGVAVSGAIAQGQATKTNAARFVRVIQEYAR